MKTFKSANEASLLRRAHLMPHDETFPPASKHQLRSHRFLKLDTQLASATQNSYIFLNKRNPCYRLVAHLKMGHCGLQAAFQHKQMFKSEKQKM